MTALALLAVVVPAWSAPSGAHQRLRRTLSRRAEPGQPRVPTLSVSLLASSPTVPTGGTFGYTAEVRLAQRASYLQTVFEVSRPSGQLLFKRTRIVNDAKRGTSATPSSAR